MVAKPFRCLMIPLILSSFERIQAGKEHIINSDGYETGLDRKSQAMVDLISECLSRDPKLLCIGEKLNVHLFKHIHEPATATVVSLASSKLVDERISVMKGRGTYQGPNHFHHTWKSAGFLFTASSPVDLKVQMNFAKETPWWNAAGFFVLVEAEDAVGDRCSNAYEFLSLIWKYGLLSSVFLCQEQDGTLSMYSYNPYGNSAPHPWLMVRETKGQNEHPWNLFKWKKYEGRGRSCDMIFFDKTKSLAGYPMGTNALSAIPFLFYNKSGNDVEKYRGIDGTIMKELWRFLNATIVDVPQPDQDAFLGWMDENGTYHGNLKDIESGKVEIGLNSLVLRPVWKLTPTYPHSTTRLCFVVKDQGGIPWLFGLFLVFDRWTMACGVTLFLVATMIFGYFDRRRYFAWFLNTLRIFQSSSLVILPRSTNLRIIMCFVYLYPIVIYSTIQGKILSMIQNPLRYKNIDHFGDILVQGFKIEGPEAFKALLPTDNITDFFVTNDMDNCLKKLYNNEPVACLDYCITLVVKASYRRKLHIAQGKSPSYRTRYVAKPDWPLVDRFNSVIQRFLETGLIKHFADSSIYENLNITSLFPDDSSESVPVQINLKDFLYVFIGILFGWSFAIVAFIGELLINRLKN